MSIWRQVDTGGVLTVSKWRDEEGTETVLDMLGSAGIEDCNLQVRKNNATILPIGQRSESRKGVQTDFRISFNRALEDDDTLEAGEFVHSLMALMLPAVKAVYATYKDANADVLFAGWCVPEEATDTQRGGDFARQAGALVNTGDPDTP